MDPTSTAEYQQLSAYLTSVLHMSEEEAAVYLSTNNYDGQTIDAAILQDPAFQAYWQMTYLKLMEIIDPTLVMAGYAVEGGNLEALFNYVYARADQTTNDNLETMALDNVNLFGLSADVDGDPNTDPQAIVDAANAWEAANSGSSGYDYVNEEAYQMLEDTELDNEAMLTYAISFGDYSKNFISYCQDQTIQIMAEFASITDLLNSGEITPEVASGMYGQQTATMQFWNGLQQNALSQDNTVLELFSEMVKADSQAKQQVIGNVKATV